jgi:hypothetical protein
LQELSKFLDDGTQVANAIHGSDTTPEKVQTSVRQAANVSKEIRQSQPGTILAHARQLIERVDFDGKQISTKVSLAGLSECIEASDIPENGFIQLETPIMFRRRGVESKIILPGASKAALPDSKLIDLVSNAYQWSQNIFKREVTTVREISQNNGVDESDVSRFLPFAFLAPDIVEAILRGSQPTGITSEKIKRLRNLPKSWEEQRQLLGFTS